MPGIRVFRTLAEAIAQGYEAYDKTKYGWLVRMRLGTGYALAIVDTRT
jgi:hypothetical protein